MRYKLTNRGIALKKRKIRELRRENLEGNIPIILCGLGSIALFGIGSNLTADDVILSQLANGSGGILAAYSGLSAFAFNTSSIVKLRRKKIKLLKKEIKEFNLTKVK